MAGIPRALWHQRQAAGLYSCALPTCLHAVCKAQVWLSCAAVHSVGDKALARLWWCQDWSPTVTSLCALSKNTACNISEGFSCCVQTTKIGQLSEGQKSRLVFGMICMQRPNLLLLDEPTNHLDIESIDALADAIKAFNGGLVLVSHDFRLIDQARPSQSLKSLH